MSSKPVSLVNGLHRTMPAQIADWIAAGIVEEQFVPGQRLAENELAERLGVSRAPLREALRMLETRGMVTITPQRGARVTLPSTEELMHLFEIRAVLAGLGARELARRWDATLDAALAPFLETLERSVDDAQAYAQASAALALEISKGSGNPKLAEMMASFAMQIGRYTRLGLSAPDRRERSIRTWRRVFEALRNRDAEVAETLSRRLATENRDSALRTIAERAVVEAVKAAPSPIRRTA